MKTVQNLFSYKPFLILFLLFVILTIWRVSLIFLTSSESVSIQIWAASYQTLAWFGAIFGLFLTKSWGGLKSVVGRATLAFALGLLAQSFGQSVFSYYFYTGIEAPYPSLADLGFFGSIPFYIYGALLLGRATGSKISLRSFSNQIQAVVIPLMLLGLSYFLFLKDHEYDWSSPVTAILDFGYPLGQALYVSVAILVFILSRKLLGGIMRAPMLFFLIALVSQYLSDFTFLYQASRGIFVGGGIVDYMYLLSYFLMALSLIALGNTYKKALNSN